MVFMRRTLRLFAPRNFKTKPMGREHTKKSSFSSVSMSRYARDGWRGNITLLLWELYETEEHVVRALKLDCAIFHMCRGLK